MKELLEKKRERNFVRGRRMDWNNLGNVQRSTDQIALAGKEFLLPQLGEFM